MVFKGIDGGGNLQNFFFDCDHFGLGSELGPIALVDARWWALAAPPVKLTTNRI